MSKFCLLQFDFTNKSIIYLSLYNTGYHGFTFDPIASRPPKCLRPV